MPPSKEPPINLLRGSPNTSLLPAALLKSAASTVLSDPRIYSEALTYYDPELGYTPLRENLAVWLTTFYRSSQSQHQQEPVTPDRLCITGGASQNLACILAVYTDPEYTRNIWLVAPAYFLSFRIFEDAGFGTNNKMRAVPEDAEGLDIAFLRKEMERTEERARKEGLSSSAAAGTRYKPPRARAKVYKHIIYCVPTFSNPSSRTLTLDRRRALVRLAREFDALVVCDDVYDFLQWSADLPSTSPEDNVTHVSKLPRVVDVDRDLDGGASRTGADGFGNVCSNGSFSKISGPGIRVGWCEGTEKFAYGVSQGGATCSGGPPSQLTSAYMNELVASGALQNYIHKTLLPAYALRYRRLMGAVERYLLPLGFSFPQPDREVIGGYFTWLRLPPKLHCSAQTLTRRCLEEENVVIAEGNLFEVPGDQHSELTKFDRNLRLCWAWEDEDKLEEGVRRVGNVVRRILERDERELKDRGFVVVARNGDASY